MFCLVYLELFWTKLSLKLILDCFMSQPLFLQWLWHNVLFVIPNIPFCEVPAAGGGLLTEGVVAFFIPSRGMAG